MSLRLGLALGLGVGLSLIGAALLALCWWGWQQGGLAFLQLGLGAC